MPTIGQDYTTTSAKAHDLQTLALDEETKLMRAVWRTQLSSTARAVLTYLLLRARCYSDQHLVAWPSIEQICLDLGIKTRATIIKALNELELQGFVLRWWLRRPNMTIETSISPSLDSKGYLIVPRDERNDFMVRCYAVVKPRLESLGALSKADGKQAQRDARHSAQADRKRRKDVTVAKAKQVNPAVQKSNSQTAVQKLSDALFNNSPIGCSKIEHAAVQKLNTNEITSKEIITNDDHGNVDAGAREHFQREEWNDELEPSSHVPGVDYALGEDDHSSAAVQKSNSQTDAAPPSPPAADRRTKPFCSACGLQSRELVAADETSGYVCVECRLEAKPDNRRAYQRDSLKTIEVTCADPECSRTWQEFRQNVKPGLLCPELHLPLLNQQQARERQRQHRAAKRAS